MRGLQSQSRAEKRGSLRQQQTQGKQKKNERRRKEIECGELQTKAFPSGAAHKTEDFRRSNNNKNKTKNPSPAQV